jgi:hypothetical protein
MAVQQLACEEPDDDADFSTLTNGKEFSARIGVRLQRSKTEGAVWCYCYPSFALLPSG